MTKITMTEKVEIYVDGTQEERDSFFNFFWKNSNQYVKALNLIYSHLLFEESIKDTIKNYDDNYSKRESEYVNSIKKLSEDKEKNKKKIEKKKSELSKFRSEKNKEANEILTNAIGLKSMTRSRDIGKTLDFDLADFVDSANNKATKDFSNDFIGIKIGQITPRNYRNKNKQGLLPFRGRDIKIIESDNKFYICLPKGYRFKVNLGAKPSKAYKSISVLKNIISQEYKLNQSSLVFKQGKLFMNLTVTFEKDYNNLELEEGKALTVSFDELAKGVCLVNGKEISKFGDDIYIKNYKSKIKAMKSREQSRGVFAKGGHGRKRKLDHDKWEAIKTRESNFVKTYNNQCTARIVQTAIRNKVSVIVVEEPDKEFGEWAYYQFSEQLKRKSSRYGIEVLG